MALTKNLHLAATLILVYNGFILTSNGVNITCTSQSPREWKEFRACIQVEDNCDSGKCESCKECQIKYPGFRPLSLTYSCVGAVQGVSGALCPVAQCSYCLACNTSDLATLDIQILSSVAVCKGCSLEDTIFWDYNTTFAGAVGACRVILSCQKSDGYFRPVLLGTPICPRRSSEIDFVDPERGPVAGGTILKITGNGLINITRVAVGEAVCDPLPFRSSNDDSHLRCQVFSAKTPEKVTLKVQTVVWPVTWVNSNATFEFRQNPQVTDITEASTIAAGGIQVSFKGRYLGSSKSPVLVVAAVCKANQNIVKNFIEECESSDDETTLYCSTPDVDDVSGTDACNSSEASGSSNSYYSRFDFSMGLQFDGYLRYSSLPDLPQFGKEGYLQVYNNVNIYNFTEDQSVKEVDLSRNSILIIRGDNMNRGARIIDYDIYLGKDTSCVVLSLLSDQISCRLPEVAPPIHQNGSFVYKGQETARVVVKVGNLQVHVGYVYYVPSFLLPTILLSTLLPGAAIIAVVVAVILCIKRRKTRKSPETSQGRDSRGRRSFNLYFSIRDRQSQLRTPVIELAERLREELESYIVLRSDITLKEFLGQGQFGKIYRALLPDNKVVAAKLLKDGSTNVDVVSKFLEEAVLMKDFRHENVLGLCGVVLDVEQPMVLVELMEYGDLRTVIKREPFPLGDLINFCTQIANGMAYLSAQKFIHRDLAARNCLLDRSYRVKIGDFGLSHDLDAKDYYRCKDHTKPLPVKWMAPESLANGLFTTASDVWSYGVVMWEIMAKGHVPYADVNNYEIKRFLLSGCRLDCPAGTPIALYEVMKLCWNAEPSKRPTFVKLLSLIDEFTTGESVRPDLERRFTQNINQETYMYTVNSDDVHAVQLNDYQEIVVDSL